MVDQLYKVVIDPGHGGYDPGAVSPIRPEIGDELYTRESDLTLSISILVAQILSKVCRVKMTRTTDVALGPGNLDLTNRIQIANEWDADVCVSIHLNSAVNPNGRGTETFRYYNSVEGLKLATNINSRIVNATGLYDRGVKEAGFALLKTKCVAALVECCFISNPDEERLINDPVFQLTMATAIADGIAAYLGLTIPIEGVISVGTSRYFGDVKKDWGVDDFDLAYSLGIISGRENGTFDPDAPITRYEATAVVMRSVLVVLKALGHSPASLESQKIR